MNSGTCANDATPRTQSSRSIRPSPTRARGRAAADQRMLQRRTTSTRSTSTDHPRARREPPRSCVARAYARPSSSEPFVTTARRFTPIDLAGLLVEPGLKLAGGTEGSLRGVENRRFEVLDED